MVAGARCSSRCVMNVDGAGVLLAVVCVILFLPDLGRHLMLGYVMWTVCLAVAALGSACEREAIL